MSADHRDRIGVIVIHGVGKAEEGWTDNHLIPELESWLAHEGLPNDRGAERKPATKPADNPEPLSIVLRTADNPIVILVRTNEEFARLCAGFARDHLITDPRFETGELRLRNRHQIMEDLESVSASRPGAQILAGMRELGLPSTYAFSRASEVHRVRDPESSSPTKTWKSYSRRCSQPDREIAIAELFWADMSKVGDTVPTRTMALIQLFLESPYILGRAFLKPGEGRTLPKVISPLAWIAGLIQLANWLMRWPISGLNAAVFSTAFFAILLKAVGPNLDLDFATWLPATIAIGLLVTAAAGYSLFSALVHRKLGLADLSLAAMSFSFVLLASFGAATAILALDPTPGTMQAVLGKPESYVIFAAALLLLSWFAWSVVINTAGILLILLAIPRALAGVFFKSRHKPVPLARPAAAISLSLLLGIVWKFLLTISSLLIIVLLIDNGGALQRQECLATTGLADFSMQGTSQACAVEVLRTTLLAVGVLNGIALLLVVAALIGVFLIRAILKRLYRGSAMAGRLKLPRVIASPLIVATLIAGSFINVIALNQMLSGTTLAESDILSWLSRINTVFSTPAAAMLSVLVLSFLARRVIEYSNGFVHIGRDLVDHQYDPSDRSLAVRLKDLSDREAARLGHNNHQRFRRRMRIQRRLEALIEDVIGDMDVNRLVFVAHSQGTVIMHDYLINHDDLIARTHDADDRLSKVQSIDLLTVGSPLEHLYRYYFADYDQSDRAAADNSALMNRVNTWTNMWRVDDPIGQEVWLHDAIENIGLPPGGHLDYWREPAVCEEIWGLIRGDVQRARAVQHAPIGDRLKVTGV